MKLMRVLFVCLIATVFAGCLRVDQTLSINADGSGELDMSYAMQESTIRQMEQVAKMQAAQDGHESQADADQFEFSEKSLRKRLRPFEEHGIEIIAIDSKTAEGWKTMHVKLGFKDLDALMKTDSMNDSSLSIKKNAEGNYVLLQKTAEDAADEGGGEEDMTPEMLQRMAPIFAGMKIVQRIEVPGKIIKSNASEVEGDTASWIYDVDKDPSVINKIRKLRLEIEFEGEGLDLKEI